MRARPEEWRHCKGMDIRRSVVDVDRKAWSPGCSRATVKATPSRHQVMRHIGNGSTVEPVRNDTEIVSRIMPEQRQLERLGSI
jgi:hypothetical protein